MNLKGDDGSGGGDLGSLPAGVFCCSDIPTAISWSARWVIQRDVDDARRDVRTLAIRLEGRVVETGVPTDSGRMPCSECAREQSEKDSQELPCELTSSRLLANANACR